MSTLPTIAGETRIQSLPGRPTFMMIREIAEIVGLKPKTLERAFQRNRKKFPEGYFFVLTEAEFSSRWRRGVATSRGKRTDLEQVAITEKGAILLLSLMTGPDVIPARISLIDTIFTSHAAEREALRSALVEDEAGYIGRSTIKAQIKIAAQEGWTYARLLRSVNCSQPDLVRAIQGMRVRGYIPQDALLPPVYVLREMARKDAHLAEHEMDSRQLLLGLGG